MQSTKSQNAKNDLWAGEFPKFMEIIKHANEEMQCVAFRIGIILAFKIRSFKMNQHIP